MGIRDSSNVVSQQGEGYVTGNNAKKGNNDELYMRSGRYTTCDQDVSKRQSISPIRL